MGVVRGVAGRYGAPLSLHSRKSSRCSFSIFFCGCYFIMSTRIMHNSAFCVSLLHFLFFLAFSFSRLRSFHNLTPIKQPVVVGGYSGKLNQSTKSQPVLCTSVFLLLLSIIHSRYWTKTAAYPEPPPNCDGATARPERSHPLV